MSDQERYIQILEQENHALRRQLCRVRNMLMAVHYNLHKMLDESYAAADQDYADLDSEEQAVVQHMIEEVLSDAE